MKALCCTHHGLPETLKVMDLPDLTPTEHQAVLRVRAAGVNFPDTLIIQNRYQFKPELPFSPGGECAGEVLSVGAKVKNVKPGDRVIAFPGWGAFAEQVAADARALLPMPPELDFVTASAFVMTYATSYHALKDRGRLQAGETLLVLGAAGGVGLAAIEIGKALGARVIAAASSAEKLAICKAHGADEGIEYTREDLRERLKTLTGGKGVDVVYDPVGGATTELAVRSLAWRGRLLVVGFANGEIPKIPLNLALLKGADFCGVFWGDYARREPLANLGDLRVLLQWLQGGTVKPHIAGTYSLAEAPQALRLVMDRKAIGKLVVTP